MKTLFIVHLLVILRNVEHFLLPTDTHNAERVELLKHSKIDKNAPTCFGLHGDHLQGAKVSTWLKIHVMLTVDTCKMCRGSSVLWLHIVTVIKDMYGICK